jgi:imidazolonepropionase-like amidohydrolase
VIESADDAEREVAAEKAAGYDFVKVYSKLSPVAYTAILEAAKRHGMRVVGHVPEAVGLLEVLSAGGQTSIEHLTGYMSAAQTEKSKAAEMSDWNGRRKEMVAHIDDAKIPILARKTQVAGTWSCVTLLVYQRFFQLEHLEELMKLPEVKYVVPEMLKMWDPANDFRFKGTTQEDFAAMRAVLAFHMRMTRALKDAGAKILLGTDTSNPFVVAGFAVHQELSLLVEAGLTPYEAIRAGTSDGADFLGAGDDFGRVRPGLRADLVLVDGNPRAVDPRERSGRPAREPGQIAGPTASLTRSAATRSGRGGRPSPPGRRRRRSRPPSTPPAVQDQCLWR